MTRTAARTKRSLVLGAVAALIAGGLGLAPGGVAVAEGQGEPEEVVIDLGTYQGRPAVPERIALGGGRLGVVARVDPEVGRRLYAYDLAVTGTPEPGPRWTDIADVWDGYPEFGPLVHALGDGRFAYTNPSGASHSVSGEGMSYNTITVGQLGTEQRMVAAEGRFFAVDEPSTGRQYVANFDGELPTVLTTRPISAVAIWGSTMWTPGSNPGWLRWYDLARRTDAPYDQATGLSCTPDELQKVGRWFYWRCDGAARSWIWDSGVSFPQIISLPYSKSAKLGDGFVVQQGDGTGALTMTDFHGGAREMPVTTTLADKAAPGAGMWSVDKYGGHVAYTDTEGRIHIKPVTVPRGDFYALDVSAPATVDDLHWPWRAKVLLNRPSATRTFKVKDWRRGVLVNETSTERTAALVSAQWDARDREPKDRVSGPYQWEMTVQPADGTGESWTPGSLRLVNGASAFRDMNADGYGEFYSMTTTGKAAVHHPRGGARSWATTGWDPRTRLVPYGSNTDNPRSNVLIRTPDGTLYRAGGGSNPIDPKEPLQLMGKGWNGFDAFAASDDFSGDGRPDLLVRQAATGYLFLYRGNARAGLDPAVKVGSGWKGWKIIGADDLNGDGIGDLLARDAGGEVWRYDGTGTGSFKPRTLVFSNWGAGRRDIIAVGDVTGDGVGDLLSRDTNGKLLRNRGDGRGSFGSTEQIGSGWQYYRALF
ncbi:VCBS repeat-containing protein [Streptomyces sp. NBC_00322]|uniref:FG-GAP repeat domain-containing protein n=1 Tax=Streptomyces sp. NBC_00322 TaxID=2975712 RepID=UPI002E27D4FB|nr:VCBS repeat-containing protein [Streptomyces sp. NBC_00322]